MQLLLALLGIVLRAPWASALSFEASEEMELGMTYKAGEGGRVGRLGTKRGLLAERSWRGSWPRP